MDFRILGPLEAYVGDRPLALGGTRQRALLGMLLLHANEVVSSDRLIDELWGEERRDDAAKALQVAISRLRKVLEPGRPANDPDRLLVTRSPGYELRLGPEELDLHSFERLVAGGRAAVAAGDHEDASAKFSEALALWRGAPFADLAYESFCQVEIGRLEEARLAALEERIAADLERGLGPELVAELQGLVGSHPLRERLRAQLMLALYRAGRQADALEVYADARRVLVEELGIEPGRELQELQRKVLDQDPGLDAPTAAEGPASSGSFVGRAEELATLDDALDRAMAGRGGVVLLAGEPGIGKSRLADELTGRAQARGARILLGRCWEAGGAPAYWPWVQSLRVYVREAEPETLRAGLGAGAADLVPLLPELRELFPDLGEPAAQESEGARFRLFDAASSFLRRATQAGPIVLVLDDLHAADEPSLLLLRFVAREIADTRLLVVCAFRDVDPALHDPLVAALAQLVREPNTVQISLGGLSDGDVGKYIELSTGVEAPSRLVEAIHGETEGNPLFVGEVVRLLDAEGRLSDEDPQLGIPAGVRAVIGQRVGRLSEHCRALLLPAAVLGREFGLDALGQLSGLSRAQLFDALEEALTERVVGEVPGSPGRLRFAHALIRDTLYDELTALQGVRLHLAAGGALEAVYAGDLAPHFAELAQHFFGAVPAVGPDKAIDYARRAGDRASSQHAYEEAIRLYEMALTLAGENEARCDLLLALADAEGRAGDTPASKQSFRDAADLAERLELPEHIARAAHSYAGRVLWDVTRGDVDHVPLLERALAALGEEDSTLRVRLLSRLAGGPLRDASFPPERRRSLGEEALGMARRIGDPETLAYGLSGYMLANQHPDYTHRQVTLATELVRVATEWGDLERAAEGHEQRAAALIELGDIPAAKADLTAMAKLASELRQPSQEWIAAVYGGLLALLEGDLDDAEDLIAGARRVGERALSWSASVAYGLQTYVLRYQQGRLEEVDELVRRSVEEYPTYLIWRCVLVQMAAELEHGAEAHETLDTLAADRFAKLPFDEMWLVSLGLLAEAANRLGDGERASVLHELLLPYGDRVAIAYPEITIGALARYLGLSAATAERWGDAERHFEDALDLNERIGARPWLAHTRHDYARMLLARDASGDPEKARLLLSQAETTYRELGMERRAERAALAATLSSR
jgi:DNA-binding SARP family transcriptional activator